jgi:photosystem II stability/assembly factor-like uncharacterized protein
MATTTLSGTWTQAKNAPGNTQYQCSICSSDGSKILVGCNPGLYLSIDYGNTWTTIDSDYNYNCAVANITFTKFVFGQTNGYLYSYDTITGIWIQCNEAGNKHWSSIIADSTFTKFMACNNDNGTIVYSGFNGAPGFSGGGPWKTCSSAGSGNWSCLFANSTFTRFLATNTGNNNNGSLMELILIKIGYLLIN